MYSNNKKMLKQYVNKGKKKLQNFKCFGIKQYKIQSQN